MAHNTNPTDTGEDLTELMLIWKDWQRKNKDYKKTFMNISLLFVEVILTLRDFSGKIFTKGGRP